VAVDKPDQWCVKCWLLQSLLRATHERICVFRKFSSFVVEAPRRYRLSMQQPLELRMKLIPLSLMVMVTLSAAAAPAPRTDRSVSLTQDPLVMRLNKDEFRIAFGINGERCGDNGCSGIIRYRVEWKTTDGTARSEIKHVHYSVSPHAPRTIAVDRQYFDTAEGQHTTDVVKVSIDAITCLDGVSAVEARVTNL
jgi:hypothetical protein